MVLDSLQYSCCHWDVACKRIKATYLSTDEGKLNLTKMERKIRKTILMSLQVELAVLYRTEPTGSTILAALTKHNANWMLTVAVFHKVQRLEEELRSRKYHVNEIHRVHSLPAKIDEFALIETQNWCGNAPAKDMEDLEEQIRTTRSRHTEDECLL
ncbi:unnamed protein product [Peronospora belbahrii]|uniref:Uncharacterized protein n=1 Tax=Peronospora belbahrii TaxID=622444 RepID=A0AAU9L842_9STRA|nr:unnamed protein product [Peronospora belbahrii]